MQINHSFRMDNPIPSVKLDTMQAKETGIKDMVSLGNHQSDLSGITKPSNMTSNFATDIIKDALGGLVYGAIGAVGGTFTGAVAGAFIGGPLGAVVGGIGGLIVGGTVGAKIGINKAK